MFHLFSIAMMWLMIFGVGCFYYGMLPKEKTNHVIAVTSVSLFSGCVAWLFIGYPLAFGANPLFAQALSTSDLLNLLFQLCFCLYAIVMVIGSVVDRIAIKHATIISFAWVILVYAPLVQFFWSENGFIANLGALDFSGGMVVHLSAGLASYILAYRLPKTTSHSTNRNEWLYIGMIFITLGWFFFNAGPVGELNEHAILIMINTLLALITGGAVWASLHYKLEKTFDTAALLNGTIVGLVTSTSSVGFVNTYQLLIIVSLSSAVTYLAIRSLLPRFNIDDVVDSFGMNGIGGLCGSIGTVLFIPNSLIGQFTGISVTILLSGMCTYLLSLLLKKQH